MGRPLSQGLVFFNSKACHYSRKLHLGGFVVQFPLNGNWVEYPLTRQIVLDILLTSDLWICLPLAQKLPNYCRMFGRPPRKSFSSFRLCQGSLIFRRASYMRWLLSQALGFFNSKACYHSRKIYFNCICSWNAGCSTDWPLVRSNSGSLPYVDEVVKFWGALWWEERCH